MTHQCPRPGCDKRIALSLYSCRPHWYELPGAMQREIWAGYREGRMSPRWLAADQKAKEWWAAKDGAK